MPDPGGGAPVPRGAAGLTGQLDHGDVARVFREEHGRAVAILVRVFGDIDIAEDADQDRDRTSMFLAKHPRNIAVVGLAGQS